MVYQVRVDNQELQDRQEFQEKMQRIVPVQKERCLCLLKQLKPKFKCLRQDNSVDSEYIHSNLTSSNFLLSVKSFLNKD